MSYRYPLLGASSEVRTNPPVEAVRNAETILPDSFCAFEFSMNASTLYEELGKNPLTVMVWHKDKLRKDVSIGTIRVPLADILGAASQAGPNGTTIQVLDHRYSVVGTEVGRHRSLVRLPSLAPPSSFLPTLAGLRRS